MRKKASILMVSLWILAMLTVLVVGVSHRVSLNLKISRYQKDKVKAMYLAKAGINWAIKEIFNDVASKGNDLLIVNRQQNEALFKEIRISDNQKEFAEVSYIKEDNNIAQTVYGVRDEESKININEATQEQLIGLLETYGGIGINEATAIAKGIIAWRGSAPCDNAAYQDSGYSCKQEKFSNIEELNLVSGITPDIYEKLKDAVTVWGSDKPNININTASSKTLEILADAVGPLIQKESVDSVVKNIINYRVGTEGPFEDDTEINNFGTNVNVLTQTEERALFSAMKPYLKARSNYFRIESNGKAGDVTRKITAIYSYSSDTIVYWHQN